MSPRRVCLVTPELHPCSSGGIGRLLHNLLEESIATADDTEFHVLVPEGGEVEPERARQYFRGRVHVHTVVFREGAEPTVEFERLYAPPWAYSDSQGHSQSLDIMLALRRLARGGLVFDHIEFPDFRGWAFCTLHEKRLGSSFLDAEIVVRLHGTLGIIQHFEARLLDAQHMGYYEIERRALEEADRVVAHLSPIATFYRSFYGFTDSWEDGVSVETPPLASGGAGSAGREAPRSQPDLLFVTKIQGVKRPDLFVRGCALLMRQQPEFQGRAIVACHLGRPEDRESLEALIPPDLRHRFAFGGPESEAERSRMMAGNVVVIASEYESLSLAAYEAAAAGATLVLNGRCPAFGPDSLFQSGKNCHAFDGTVEGLAATLSEALAVPHPERVQWQPDFPYWRQPRRPRESKHAPERLPRVSVVITNHNLGRYLPEAFASVAASTHPDIEIVVVDDASTEPFDQDLLGRLESAGGLAGQAIKVVRNGVNRGLPASRNIGIRAASGRYILPLDADDVIGPRFLEEAVRALESNPGHDVVVPSVAYFCTDEEREDSRFCDFAMFLGNVTSIGMVANRFSCATALIRRSVFDTVRYNEDLPSFEDWDFYLRLAWLGHRFLVTNDVQFFYRRRPGSMVKGVSAERKAYLLSQIYASLPAPPPGLRLSATLVPALLAEVARAELQATLDRERALFHDSGLKPLRYKVVDRVNAAIKGVPGVHKLLKRTAGAGASLVRKAKGSAE